MDSGLFVLKWCFQGWHFSESPWPEWERALDVRLSHWLGEEPTSSPAWSLLATRFHNQTRLTNDQTDSVISGSTVILVVPLHNIEVQLMQDCQKYGISALAGCQVNTKQPWVIPLSQSRYTWLLTSDPSERLGARHEQSPKTSDLQRGIPRRLSGALYALSWYMQLLNSHEQVRQTLMKSRLSPPGQRPIVCIDEAQVRVFLLSSSIIWSFNLGLRPGSWMGRLQD